MYIISNYWMFFPEAIILIILFFSGMRIIPPTQRGIIERLGKYERFANTGFHWIIPGIEKMVRINITEHMVSTEPQEITTNDNLNSRIDALVYFKIKDDEESNE
jgi:regulator of protease activity HflC (stomatin/prohibitin superfamily)